MDEKTIMPKTRHAKLKNRSRELSGWTGMDPGVICVMAQ
eukprot:CAMPEP_0194492798 /NCGR_PEP_ID=MMETSP0253-20130528/11226_1 /TAXON_ID=2966 /ORGANISM="Noctiluca scintillans" /LENGTH=38 /DNA_ID= /DNA_START= /DNA_END= /DNA_ORIENTATION=